MISNKSGLKRKLKVSKEDIQIKQSGLRVKNSKVFTSGPRAIGMIKLELVAKTQFHIANVPFNCTCHSRIIIFTCVISILKLGY